MRDDSYRAARQARNFVRHLNDTYPDTALFLARHAASCSGAVAAELLTVDEAGIELLVHDGGGESKHRVAFAGGERKDFDARRELAALLRASRNLAPDEPLTSLEAQLASKPAGLHARMPARQAGRES